MKRTPQELSELVRNAISTQSEDDLAGVLEDIADSVNDAPTEDVVTREQYDAVVGERDQYKASAEDYRSRYINRFYQPTNQPNDQTLIMSEASQQTIEKDEYDVSYDELFE